MQTLLGSKTIAETASAVFAEAAYLIYAAAG